jgi:hypothetical protein
LLLRRPIKWKPDALFLHFKELPRAGNQAIDALFERAGLQRNLRGKAAGVTLAECVSSVRRSRNWFRPRRFPA